MVNKQNFRYWSQNNPHELHQRPLHSPKVTVWCAMGSFEVWGPYFFEVEGATVTVTSDGYCEMLERFLCPKVAQLLADYEPDDVWFQQDGATFAYLSTFTRNPAGHVSKSCYFSAG